jgi:hypothetical protein
MSCEAGFTDNRCNGQETANPRVVWRGDTPQAGAALKTALRLLADDLETARDILKSATEQAADRLEAFEHILDFVEDPEDEKCVNVDLSSIESVRDLHDEVGEAIAGAFEDFDWETRKAWRAFEQALDHELAQ